MRRLFGITLLLITAGASASTFDLFSASTTYWENDNFGVGRKSDRFYTNGVRVVLLFDDARKPRFATPVKDWFCTRWCGNDQYFETVNLVIGQNFYTPEDITVATSQPNDRPWAGWLYGGIAENITREDRKIQHTFEVQLGILGPGAGAQATQKFVHNDLGFSNNDPQGWPNQLKNEPTINVMYRQSRRYGNETIDVVPEFGGMLGTLQTFANAGATIRLGRNITGFPLGVIVPGAVPAERPAKWELYVFAGGDAKWIPFNATLDGGFFRDGPKANGPKRFVNDLRAGVSARYRWLRFTYTVVERSKEFDVPAGRIESQRFGSVAVSIEPFDTFR